MKGLKLTVFLIFNITKKQQKKEKIRNRSSHIYYIIFKLSQVLYNSIMS